MNRAARWPVIRKVLLAIAILAASGCHRAMPSDVGGQAIRDAHPMATMAAAKRAADVNPSVVPEAAKGGALQQPPMLL